jgi:hypothetical protein
MIHVYNRNSLVFIIILGTRLWGILQEYESSFKPFRIIVSYLPLFYSFIFWGALWGQLIIFIFKFISMAQSQFHSMAQLQFHYNGSITSSLQWFNYKFISMISMISIFIYMCILLYYLCVYSGCSFKVQYSMSSKSQLRNSSMDLRTKLALKHYRLNLGRCTFIMDRLTESC